MPVSTPQTSLPLYQYLPLLTAWCPNVLFLLGSQETSCWHPAFPLEAQGIVVLSGFFFLMRYPGVQFLIREEGKKSKRKGTVIFIPSCDKARDPGFLGERDISRTRGGNSRVESPSFATSETPQSKKHPYIQDTYIFPKFQKLCRRD